MKSSSNSKHEYDHYGLSEAGSEYLSWGRYPQVPQLVRGLSWRDENPFALPDCCSSMSVLPQGLARSYGDSCLNADNLIISTRGLNRVLSFNRNSGRITLEAGVSLKDLLAVIVPEGWFIPVSPGTRFVTIGGAVANDIHGKNHHRAGSFGAHIIKLTLLRSDGSIVLCDHSQNEALFRATIGGLGLTGLILSVELQLKRITSPFIDVEEIQFHSLQEFRALSSESSERFEYTVAWIDCVSRGRNFGRGIFMRGNHAELKDLPLDVDTSPAFAFKPLATMPCDAPDWLLSSTSVRWFNGLYFHRLTSRHRRRVIPYGPFFYPLDSVLNWNRIYGKRGFFQFQCVIPRTHATHGGALDNLFKTVVDSGEASFLAVLKEFGSAPPAGLLSFPRAGTTLCLDLAHRGPASIQLYKRLETIVLECGGALYPAKDALMDGKSFEAFFPNVNHFTQHIDARFSSSFWRRVNAARIAGSIL